MLEKTLASPLDCKKIQPVHPKGHQSLVFIGRTDVESEKADSMKFHKIARKKCGFYTKSQKRVAFQQQL